MKRFIIAAFAVLCASAAFAFDTAGFTPKGSVSSYTKINYTIISKFGEYYRTPAMKSVHKFDASGKETESISYSMKDEVVDRITYEYDEQSRRTVTNYYDAKDALMHKSVSEYNADGKIAAETEYDSLGVLSGKNVYKYDDAKVTESYYDSQGMLLSRMISTRNAEGRPLEINEYFGDGTFEQKETYVYLADGRIASITVISDESSSSCEKLSYFYNDRGFLTEIQISNMNGDLVGREFYQNDDDGNPIAVKEYTVTKKFGETINELKSMTTYSYEK